MYILLHNILNVCTLYEDSPKSLIFYFVHFPLSTCTVQITLEDLLRKKNLVKSLLRCAIFSAECSNCIFVIPLTPACQRPAVDKRGRKVQWKLEYVLHKKIHLLPSVFGKVLEIEWACFQSQITIYFLLLLSVLFANAFKQDGIFKAGPGWSWERRFAVSHFCPAVKYVQLLDRVSFAC